MEMIVETFDDILRIAERPDQLSRQFLERLCEQLQRCLPMVDVLVEISVTGIYLRFAYNGTNSERSDTLIKLEWFIKGACRMTKSLQEEG